MQRSYIFVVHQDSLQKYEQLITGFLVSSWGDMFTREPVFGNVPLADTSSFDDMDTILIEPLPGQFSVCKVKDYSGIDIDQPFVFTGRTDEEKSLVCPISQVPENALIHDDGWRGFRIVGQLDFL